MNISASKFGKSRYNAGTVYNQINELCQGKLYPMLEELGQQATPTNYDLFKKPQRERIGRARLAEQYHWCLVAADRKGNSPLGIKLVEYLNQVAADEDPTKALSLMEVVNDKLGTIVTKVMEKTFEQTKLVSQSPAIS